MNSRTDIGNRFLRKIWSDLQIKQAEIEEWRMISKMPFSYTYTPPDPYFRKFSFALFWKLVKSRVIWILWDKKSLPK